MLPPDILYVRKECIMVHESLIPEKPAVTRDRIIDLLQKHPSSIAELAEELGVTQNAVRSQIALLERERFVEIRGSIKGPRRPAAVYGIRPGAEVHPSKAYPVLFSDLLRVLSKKLSGTDYTGVMRELGKQVALSAPKSTGAPRERVGDALKFLKMLGSSAEMSEEKGKIVVSSFGCPFSRGVSADARFCLAVESLLHELTGLPVTEHCDHGEHPSCRFEIKLPARSREQATRG
jgi:predicted ArsR family transcriptional regulator